MEQFTPIKDRPAKPVTAVDILLRFLVLPLVFLVGLYGLFRYVIIGS